MPIYETFEPRVVPIPDVPYRNHLRVPDGRAGALQSMLHELGYRGLEPDQRLKGEPISRQRTGPYVFDHPGWRMPLKMSQSRLV